MSASNKYFDSLPKRPEHPRIRVWRSYRKAPAVHHVGVEILQERDGLVTSAPRLFVFFYGKDGEVVKDDEVLWEPELESWLIDEERARASSAENEKLRFSLLLKPALRPVLVRYGDGYFNSVLIADLREGPFRDHPEVADMLRSIHENQPGGDSRFECQQLIDHEFARIAQKVLGLYAADRAMAEDILGGAIARYLDDRFSVTNSRLLGFT